MTRRQSPDLEEEKGPPGLSRRQHHEAAREPPEEAVGAWDPPQRCLPQGLCWRGSEGETECEDNMPSKTLSY